MYSNNYAYTPGVIANGGPAVATGLIGSGLIGGRRKKYPYVAKGVDCRAGLKALADKHHASAKLAAQERKLETGSAVPSSFGEWNAFQKAHKGMTRQEMKALWRETHPRVRKVRASVAPSALVNTDLQLMRTPEIISVESKEEYKEPAKLLRKRRKAGDGEEELFAKRVRSALGI